MTNLLLNHQWRLCPSIPAIRKLAFFLAFAFFPLLSPAANPETSALLLAGVGLALLMVVRSRRPSKATLLVPALLAALATSPVQAQSDPDFSNVNDILYGNRTLLNVTDVQVTTVVSPTQIWLQQGLTSNSSVTQEFDQSYDFPQGSAQNITMKAFPARCSTSLSPSR